MTKDTLTDLFPQHALDGVIPPDDSGEETSALLSPGHPDDFPEPDLTLFQEPRVHIFTVGEILSRIRLCLDEEFATIHIQGEISSFSRAASGHCYFTIREGTSCLKCVMFRNAASRLSFSPAEGDNVLCTGRLNIYAGRGDLQLVAESMEPAGQGILFARFQELKTRLEAEGLFDPAVKQEIPRIPRMIFLVTSRHGAAARDFIKTARNRWPGVEISLVPTLVQGEEAAPEIISALETAQTHACRHDVIVLTRGGGSIEDLWAFNEESVVRAVARCTIPIVSAIGHETDFSLTDYASDFRAATPTAAAVAVTPDAGEWLRSVDALKRRASSAIHLVVSNHRVALQELRHRLRDPGTVLAEQRQRVDEAVVKMEHVMELLIERAGARVADLHGRLRLSSPERTLEKARSSLSALEIQLSNCMNQRLQAARANLGKASARLESVSPLSVLSRGYSLVLKKDSGRVLRDSGEVAPGDRLLIKPHNGEVECEVTSVS